MEKDNLVKISEITPAQVAGICDHTFLSRPESYREKGKSSVKTWEKGFDNFLKETVSFPEKPYAVCIRPEAIKYVRDYLNDSKTYGIDIASVVGFPHGSFYDLSWKINETVLAIEQHAEEIDFVINYQELKKGNLETVRTEMRSLSRLCDEKNILLKAILETSELNENEIKFACYMAKDNNIDFVKTSSGFTNKGATARNLKVMKECFPRGIKGSGGFNIDNYQELLKAMSGRTDGYIELDPLKFRIGESSLLPKLFGNSKEGFY